MGYAVFHRDAAGTPTLEDVASLDEALAIVERSRNGDGPEGVRVFREVPIEVRTHYTVHVADEVVAPAVASVEAPAPAEAPAAPVAPSDLAEAVAEDLPEAPVEDAPVVAAVSADDAPAADGPSPVEVAEDHELRQLLESAEEPVAAPPASLPGAFPLAGPAVQPASVEVHAANVDDEDSPKRHSLFGRGG
jgi:hypothetical protein